MAYEIWELTSRNLVGTYDTEEEALDVLRKGAAAHGEWYPYDFLLGREDPDGETHLIAEGKNLVELVRNEPPTGAPKEVPAR